VLIIMSATPKINLIGMLKQQQQQEKSQTLYVTVNADGTYSVSKTYTDGVIAVEKTNNEFYVIES
jgi:hypothetical protein